MRFCEVKTVLRKLALVETIVLLIGSFSIGQEKPATTNLLEVRIELKHKKFRAGSPIEFSLTVTNAGSKPYLVPNHTSLFCAEQGLFDVTLRTSKDRIIMPEFGMSCGDCSDFGSEKIRLDDVLERYILLKPGASYTEKIRLDEQFSETKSGNYVLSGTYSTRFAPLSRCKNWSAEDIRAFPFHAWTGSATSNAVAFEIVSESRSIRK